LSLRRAVLLVTPSFRLFRSLLADLTLRSPSDVDITLGRCHLLPQEDGGISPIYLRLFYNAFSAPSFKPKEAAVSIVFCCMAQSNVSTVKSEKELLITTLSLKLGAIHSGNNQNKYKVHTRTHQNISDERTAARELCGRWQGRRVADFKLHKEQRFCCITR